MNKSLRQICLASSLFALTLATTAEAATEKVLYSFQGGTDGDLPQSPLINIDGTLYGTTAGGGMYDAGTLYSITPAGVETIIFSFGDGATSANDPFGGLTYVGGTFYGTTISGGQFGYGTAFSLNSTGFFVLHSFENGNANGLNGGLIYVDGSLYGTTVDGGAGGGGPGAVFSMALDGREAIHDSFTGLRDGGNPRSGLVNGGGLLYGTTSEGGVITKTNPYGCGAVYSIPLRGVVHVLHDFGKTATDGCAPWAALISVDGILYGTTEGGGAYGGGTVFSITHAGVEKVLHSFGSEPSGAYPITSLLHVGNRFYGTTSSNTSGTGTKDGAAFSMTPLGTVSVLHEFDYKNGDGFVVVGSLVEVQGTLYGATQYGGKYGHGAVIAIEP